MYFIFNTEYQNKHKYIYIKVISLCTIYIMLIYTILHTYIYIHICNHSKFRHITFYYITLYYSKYIYIYVIYHIIVYYNIYVLYMVITWYIISYYIILFIFVERGCPFILSPVLPGNGWNQESHGSLCFLGCPGHSQSSGIEAARSSFFCRGFQSASNLNHFIFSHCDCFGFSWVPSGNLTVCYWTSQFIVNLPIEHGGSFHSYVNVYQRVRQTEAAFRNRSLGCAFGVPCSAAPCSKTAVRCCGTAKRQRPELSIPHGSLVMSPFFTSPNH